MDRYKIQVKGDDGHEASEIFGTIVGPFGVSRDVIDGQHRVTHLHSGLLIPWLASVDELSCIEACRELAELVPWWKSHKVERIARENGLTKHELKERIMACAARFHCEGIANS